jgi:putative endonuclease
MSDAWVYMLRCSDGSLYTGWTNDLARRLATHSAGKASRYTASRLPVELAFAIPMSDRSAAMREELRIKRLSRPQKLALLGEDCTRPPPGTISPAAFRGGRSGNGASL